MAKRRRIFGIAERDWPDFQKLMAEFRAIGRTLRRWTQEQERRGARGRDRRVGKTNASHAKGATGTIKWYKNDEDTGKTFDAKNLFASLDADKWVIAERIDGTWYLVAGEC